MSTGYIKIKCPYILKGTKQEYRLPSDKYTRMDCLRSSWGWVRVKKILNTLDDRHVTVRYFLFSRSAVVVIWYKVRHVGR